jgi:hypothetical protein
MKKVEIKEIPATKEYILTISEDEAKYIIALLNAAPARIAAAIDLEEYSALEISNIIKHGASDGMCSTLRQAVYGEND